jgi:hypothetical protein
MSTYLPANTLEEFLIITGEAVYPCYLVYEKLIKPLWVRVFKLYSYCAAWLLLGLILLIAFIILIVEAYM